jgi:diacylglycerol kinase family enzyme
MDDRTLWLVVNAASGSNSEEAVEQLVTGLDGAGYAPVRIIRLPEDELPAASQLSAAGAAILVTFTGDGTAGAQIARLHDWGGRVLVLPGGTQNLLAKSFHGERTAAEIIALLGRGGLAPRQIAMIRCAPGDALCEIVAGPGATWSDVRETMRDGDVAGMAATLTEAIRQTADGPAVAVVQPALGKPEGYPAVRLHPVDGAMAVDGYGAAGLADYARQGVAILRRDFRQGPHDELGVHPAVLCRSAAPIELMLDGERTTGGPEERFEVLPCPVTFLAPAD